MLGVFISSYDENKKKFYMDFVSVVEVSSTASDIIMKGKHIKSKEHKHKKKVQFSCFDGTNSMPASTVVFSND